MGIGRYLPVMLQPKPSSAFQIENFWRVKSVDVPSGYVGEHASNIIISYTQRETK